MGTESLIVLLNDKELMGLVDHHLPEAQAPARVRYPLYAKRLGAERFVLPVAGVQGSGKSTLLNALAFDRPVLPVDADETTCVPVEIVWSAAPTGNAQVCLRTGEIFSVPATEDALRDFVHNDCNPGNEKGVDRIIVQSADPIFEPGLVLVDLPGVGSLTASNLETTHRYLDESVGVMFLLRTVPPLTRSDAVFVALQWARIPTAVFVQSCWSDETDEEVENGREHNVSVLTDLARRNRIPLAGPVEVTAVNGHQAWQGRLTRDRSLQALSGADALARQLAAVAQSWPAQLREQIAALLREELAQLQGVIEVQLRHLSESREKVAAEMAESQSRFDRYLNDLNQKRENAEAETHRFVELSQQEIESWSRDSRSELRNSMRSKMRAGIVDGPRLERALRDEEYQVADIALAELEEKSMSFQDLMRERFRDMQQWNASADFEAHTVHREERTKWENLGPTVLGAGAGVGGGWGGAWAGAEIGLKLGLATGNPIGTIIGGVVGGILGGLLGIWAGNKTRETVIGRRAKAAEPEVFRAIDDFIAAFSDDLLEQVESFQKHLLDSFQAWQEEQESRFEREKKNAMDAMAASQEERARMREVLEGELAQVQGFARLLEEGGHQ